MNALLIILLVTIGLVTLLLLIALFMKKDMCIKQSVVIQKPKKEVFDFIQYVRNHDHFSVWAMMDPDMKKEYQGIDGTVGFVYAWDSAKKKNVGAGEQEIKQIIPGTQIEFELRFTRPMQDVAKATMKTKSISDNETKVTWVFESTMKYPMNLMMGMIQKMLSKDLSTGLDNLKVYLEKTKK